MSYLHPPEGSRRASSIGTENSNNSNRFTIADYAYDREEEGATPQMASADTFEGLNEHGSLGPDQGYGSAIRPLSERPTSWGLALRDDLDGVKRPETLVSPSVQEGLVPSKQISSQATAALSEVSPSPENPFFPSRSAAPARLPAVDESHLSHHYPPTSPPFENPTSPIRQLPFIPRSTSSGIKPLPNLPSLASSQLSPSHTGPISPFSDIKSAGLLPSPIARSPSPGTPAPRPSLPSMPSAGTDLPVLSSLGRSYRGSYAGENDQTSEFGGHDRQEKERDSKAVAFLEPKVPPPDTTWRRFIPGSLNCRLLLGIVVLELIVNLTIEANILWRFNQEVNSTNSTDIMLENKRRLPIFLIIFGLAHLWQLVLTIISIRTKNTIQVTAVTLFNFAFLAWAVIQVNELRDILGNLNRALELDGTRNSLVTLPLNVLTGIIIGVVSVGCLALSVLTFYIRREFGWQRYRFLGADLQIRACYRRFQVFECFCYFSAFFCAGFGIQFIWLVLQPTDSEYIITWVAFPVSLLLLVIGRTAAKYEHRPFMYFFAFGLVLGQAYFIFKLVRIWQQATTVYVNVNKSLTVFAVLSLLALVALSVWAVLVARDFGKGLKMAVLAQEGTRSWWKRIMAGKDGQVGRSKAEGGSGRWGEKEMSAVQKRLSID